MKPCAVYIRVSDRQQVQGASLSDQEAACRAYAAREGFEVVLVYRDDGRSAWKDEIKHRPAFERLLIAAKSKRRHFEAVLVYKLDRFARKARVYHNARWQLEQAGVQLLSSSEPNDQTAAGRLSSGMLAQFAEFYSAQLSERIKGAQASKAARGLWVGPPPFGYDLRERQLVPGALWLWVVCIFVGYAKGASTVDLAQALNAASVPLRSGKPWTKDSVLMVLRGHAYNGKGGGRSLEPYEASHKALISPELWQTVQAELGTRRRRPLGPLRAPRANPLSFTPYCAECGSKMHQHRHGKIAYLRCKASLNQTCTAKGVRLETIQGQVELLRQAGITLTQVWLRVPRGIERFE